jgi:transcriptional regulator with XRE-family HTH domain
MGVLVSPSRYHRTLNGLVLLSAREAKGMSQEQFARACGWSQQYQSQLEADKLHEVHVDVIIKILSVLYENEKEEKTNKAAVD